MHLRVLVLLSAIVISAVSASAQRPRWSPEQANAWYDRQPWLMGANYVPSDAINQFEMFQDDTWNPALNDKELGLAESIGMNTIRVFLQDQLWEQSPKHFLKRLDEFLTIAAKHGIRPIFVLFDSCWDPRPRLGPQHPPTPGVHNSGWVQSPGAQGLMDPTYEPKLEAYVRGVVRKFAKDTRILAWDVWNEPDNLNASYMSTEDPHKVADIERLLPKAFLWARLETPSQPVTSGVWDGNWSDPAKKTPTTSIQLAESDIITFHNYEWPEGFEARIRELMPLRRPIICTEYMARGVGSTFDGDLPLGRQYRVGMINWGLVAGKTQTYLPWDSWHKPYVLEQPPVWFHEVFRQDDLPYRQHEVDQMRAVSGRGTKLQQTSPVSP